MDKDTAREIEVAENVAVDAEAEMYNRNGYDETYGWAPIPQEWIDEATIEAKGRLHWEDDGSDLYDVDLEEGSTAE